MTAENWSSLLLDGDMHVASQCNPVPPGDCPPDVYRFEFAYGDANLCVRCGDPRMAGRSSLEAGIGPYIEGGTCEDCGDAVPQEIVEGDQK